MQSQLSHPPRVPPLVSPGVNSPEFYSC
jgi:hypothetical protein